MSNPTILSNQFNTYATDTSTGATYFTFNYDYVGELSTTELASKNPTLSTTQFALNPVDTSTGASYLTFNYDYAGELTNTQIALKNPTLSTTQFTLSSVDTSTGIGFNTFNYDYAGELTNAQLLLKNPTLTNSDSKPISVSADNITAQFKNTNLDNANEAIKQTILWNPTTDNEQLVNNQVKPTLANLGARASNLAASLAGSYLGIPQVSQVVGGLVPDDSVYSTLAFNQLVNIPGVKYGDFRSRKIYDNKGALQDLPSVRADGASAIVRGGFNAGAAIYAGASASPFGAYTVFNLDGTGTTGYGWGDHDNPAAIRNDFTLRSHVATRWADNVWKPIIGVESLIPFRGDRVSVIDFGQRDLNNAYRWRNSDINLGNVLGQQINNTQDFIKFYFTGPKLNAGNTTDKDDIIVFRATISSLTDTFSPSWTAQTMIGRADPNYHYTGVTRDLNLDFTVYATDRDEVKPIWRKLNALAGYTAPEYDLSTIALKAPWMRITIGDLFHQQAVFITSLSYTLHDADTTWEINIERDKTMMQVPHKITVAMGLTLITDALPQKTGKFYSLAKDYDTNSQPKDGAENWLSGFKKNPQPSTDVPERYRPTLLPNVPIDAATETQGGTVTQTQGGDNSNNTYIDNYDPYNLPE